MPPIREPDDDDTSPNVSELMVHSRQLTRLVHMYWSAGVVLKQTKVWKRKDEAQRKALEDSASDEEKYIYALVKLFAELEPEVVADLARGGRGSRTLTEHTENQLSKGQSNAKAEDMRKVQGLLVVWRTWNPPLNAEDQSTRGLNHRETAFYLSSFEVDWGIEEECQKFMAGAIEISELDFPRLCYPNGEGNKDRPWVGAFFGELLIKGARAIIFSPAASKGNTPAMTAGGARGHRRGAKTRGPIGLAKRYDMTEVTIPFIAYVTVVVRNALTSDVEYSDNASGFDYELFYNEIRAYLEDPKHEQVTAKVIKFWNEELFSQFRRRNPAGAGRAAGRGGTRAMLDAALEAGEDLGLGDDNGAEGGRD
ncbi:hypothetical protein FS749_006469 [Ceratobasidium sp. UAMH 11750]|nr:hypothetical protein FS749_006469 [Ceratobasidium sp. UAMH 11750]